MKSDDSIKAFAFLSYNILWLRRHYGISKKKMASLLGIGLWSLNKIERGELPQRLSIEVLFTIRNQFGVLPSELFSQKLGD